MSDWKKVLNDAGQAVQAVESLAKMDVPAIVNRAVSLLTGGTRLESVAFGFESSAEPTGGWRVLTLHLREALSEPYTCVLELANELIVADPDVLLGSTCRVSITRDTRTRWLHGIVHRVEHLGLKASNRLARVHIAPALWALSQRFDSYIFQEMTVPEILSDVLQEALTPFKRTVRLELTQKYPKREYCVQYRESDLDFVLRLMEEEGITFYFDHSGEAEELVLVDANECCPPLQTLDGQPLGIHGPEGDTASVESLRFFGLSSELRTNRVVIREFDWSRRPLEPEKFQVATEGGSVNKVALEQYEHQSPMTLGKYDKEAGQYTEDDGTRQAKLRLQGYAAREHQGQGRSNVIGMCPGLSFELVGHVKPELDQRYLLTRVEHFGQAPEQLTHNVLEQTPGQPASERYFNRIECIPARLPFRPERQRPRPRISGIQTATVVGPKEDTLHTDKHGRIKVRFHWDRISKGDEYSSCFVRVAQSWAGPQFGTFFLPRVGMEVLIDFIEGDPDRPLALGCVYNGRNLPPYALPNHQTRSTLKTRSIKQQEEQKTEEPGFNELRFEDLAGEEEIFLHAQKDFNEVVLHQHNTTVGDNQTNTVKANQVESIDKDQTLTVKGNRSRTIDKNETVTIHQNRTKTVDKDETRTIHGSRTTTIDKDETVTISGARTETVTGKEAITLQNERTTNIAQNDQLAVGGDKSTQVTGSYSIAVGPTYVVTQGGTTLALSEGHANLKADKSLQAHNGSGALTLAESGGIVQLSANEKLVLVCGNASIVLEQNGTITVSGTTSVNLGCQKSAIKLEPPSVTVSGPQITSSAIGIHEITGALIKIN